MRHEMLTQRALFLPSRQYKKGHAESAFRDACRHGGCRLSIT